MKHISDLTKKELFQQALQFDVDTRDLSLPTIRKRVTEKNIDLQIQEFLKRKYAK